MASLDRGVAPESLGRKATAVGDRDVASRDTVYRKPKAAAKQAAPSGGGGGGKGKGAGRGPPIPTPNPMANVATSPSSITPPMGEMPPQMPPQLAGLPMELQDQAAMPDPQMAGPPPGLQMPVMSSPSSAPGFAPAMGPTSVPGDPRTMSPTSVPGPGRDEFAAIMAGLQPQPQQGGLIDAMKMDLNYQQPRQPQPPHPRALNRLKTWFGM